MWRIFALSEVDPAAFGVEAPHVLFIGLAAVAIVALLALIRGPRRLRVPSASGDGSALRMQPDPAFLLSVALRCGAGAAEGRAGRPPVGVEPG